MPALRIVEIHSALGSQGIESLSAAKALRGLRLNLPDFDDHSLEILCKLSDLRQLRVIGRGSLSDEGIAHLEKLTGLVELGLSGFEITDAGLARLAPLTQLEYLELIGTKITGSGLAALAPLKKLRVLNLQHSRCDDDGCRQLPRFAQLRILNLSACQITDAGLEPIGGLPSLTSLKIDFNKGVTDAGLTHFASLDRLSFLSLIGTAVTQKRVDDLRVVMPNMHVAPLWLPSVVYLWHPLASDVELLDGPR